MEVLYAQAMPDVIQSVLLLPADQYGELSAPFPALHLHAH